MTRRWHAALAITFALAGCSAGTEAQPPPTHPRSPTATAPTPTRPSAVPRATPAASHESPRQPDAGKPTGSPTPEPPAGLHVGDRGEQVSALQSRLAQLGYWLGTPDGVFGDSTLHAVVALQKVAGLARDGVVGPQTKAALAAGVVPHPRTQSGSAIEVDLSRQVVLVVHNGTLAGVLDASTGGGYHFVMQGATYVATTPTGQYAVGHRVDGWDRSPLGELWRPAYFTGGIAVHGYPEVPPYPASHGCVRVTMAAMNWLWSTGAVAVGTPVSVY